jgi:pyruvate dehydrogenase E2 component (dihydrolipoamide acetyltransferase)
VVETQKGAIEIEIFETGQIERFLVDLNAKVPVGTPLAQIRTEFETQAAPSPAGPIAPATQVAQVLPGMAPPERAAAEPIALTAGPEPEVSRRPRVSPAARRLAEQRGVDVSAIAGSGPGGTITFADVENQLHGISPSPKQKRVPGLDLDAMRTAIAAAMARSKREIPHYYLEHQVDVMDCEQWVSRRNAARPPDQRLLIGVLAIKSVALAARRFPIFNGFHREGKFEPAAAIHVGTAIAIRGGGLATPALQDVDRISLDQLMIRLRDLVQRMRAGRIRSSEMSDATITVSSLGERGVEKLYGIIYPPQVAIVGFGKVVARPWVVDGTVEPRSVVTITLAADHRVSDGHVGALFLAEIGRLLQEPDKL